jgi:hypothetical protein
MQKAAADAVTFPRWTERQLRAHTAAQFACPDELTLRCEAIVKGGSVRTFHRFWLPDDRSVVCMHYSREKAENLLYAGISDYLTRRRVQVPHLLARQPECDLMWLEDLGTTDLHYFRFAPLDQREQLYQNALRTLTVLQEPDPAAEPEPPDMVPGFDVESYLWEQSYFTTNCLGHVFGYDYDQQKFLSSLPELYNMAAELGRETPAFVHRDFQSTNILVRNGTCCLIDFQGMRPGRPEYDVASLLYDPYVELPEAMRQRLLRYWVDNRPERLGTFSPRIFQLCAVQRLMQALGAYGYLGLIRGHERFLDFIQPALLRLREILRQVPELHQLEEVTRACLEMPIPRPSSPSLPTGQHQPS